jgi:hypothetical protein
MGDLLHADFEEHQDQQPLVVMSAGHTLPSAINTMLTAS